LQTPKLHYKESHYFREAFDERDRYREVGAVAARKLALSDGQSRKESTYMTALLQAYCKTLSLFIQYNISEDFAVAPFAL